MEKVQFTMPRFGMMTIEAIVVFLMITKSDQIQGILSMNIALPMIQEVIMTIECGRLS